MRTGTFTSHLYRSCVSVHGISLGVGGVVAAAALSLVPDFNLKWLVVTTISTLPVLFVAFATLFHAAFTAWHGMNQQSSRVRHSGNAPEPYPSTQYLLVSDPHPRLFKDTEASVFHKKNDVEMLIGIGRVVHIQDDDLVQVLVVPINAAKHSGILTDTSTDNLKSLLVKPGIPAAAREMSNG